MKEVQKVKTTESKKREVWIDFVKIIAIYLVIILHIFCKNMKEPNIFYFLGTCAVPLFFMVSGYLNINKNRDYSYCFKKIISIIRIVLLWNVIYLIVNICLKKVSLSPYLILYPILNSFQNLCQKEYFFQFWFLGSLIILYCLLPFISKVFNNDKKTKILLVILLCACIFWDLFNIFMNFKYGVLLNDKIVQTLRIWTWLFYFCMGGYIYKTNILSSISKKVHLFWMIFMVVLTTIYEYQLSEILYNALLAETFYNSLPVIITSILIFTYIKKVNVKKHTLISIGGSLTMGIYIIHTTIIYGFKEIIISNNDIIKLLVSIATFIICALISFIISRNSKLNKLINI